MRAAVKKAVAFQRDLAIEEDREARAAIEADGCEITDADRRTSTRNSAPP